MATDHTTTPRFSALTRVFDLLRRETSSGKFIAQIDGLRFVAIGTVVLFHLAVGLSIRDPVTYAVPLYGNLIASVARQGFHGVELFFIISGFILGYPFASYHLKGKKPVILKQYFLRRVTRLEPPYLLCMSIIFVGLVCVKGRGFTELLPHFLASIFYLHNLVFGSESLINNVAWSLEIEIQFYLLVPLLSRLFLIRRSASRRLLMVGICFMSIIFSWMFIGGESILYHSILRYIHFFLIGFLLVDFYIVEWNENPSRNVWWDLITIVGWPLLFLVWNLPELSPSFSAIGHGPVLEVVLFPVIAFFLYCAVFRGTITSRVMQSPWVTTIGGMCYTLYLFHNQLMGPLIKYSCGFAPFSSYSLNFMVQCLLVIPPVIAFSGVYFVLIEKPCMRRDWPSRLLKRVEFAVVYCRELLNSQKNRTS